MRLKKLLSLLALATAGLLGITGAQAGPAGAVYTMTNSPDNNQIVVFSRDGDGLLTQTDLVSTEGKGSGGGVDPLASQGSLILVKNGDGDGKSGGNWLLAVNAGSNDISLFWAGKDGVELADRVGSGGNFPVSVTAADDIVYVLNGGEPANITGFKLGRHGHLWPLPHSTRLLGEGSFGQVDFNPKGRALVITDKDNNNLLVFRLNRFGLPEETPEITASSGPVPFAIDFDVRGHLLVAEAGDNAVSSYHLNRDGSLDVITASEPNGQIATCWITASRRGDVFTTNPGTHSVSNFHVDPAGQVMLLNGIAGVGQTPLDMDLTDNGRYLYAVDPTLGGVDMFRVEYDGSLTALGTVDAGLADYAQGLAAR